MSLVARHLEENGLPTVVMGTALDIVEHCGVPRYLFSDFPLGATCGEPFEPGQQRALVGRALELLAGARAPRTTVRSPDRWSRGEAWKERVFTQAQPFLPEEVKRKWMQEKAAYRQQKREAP